MSHSIVIIIIGFVHRLLPGGIKAFVHLTTSKIQSGDIQQHFTLVAVAIARNRKIVKVHMQITPSE